MASPRYRVVLTPADGRARSLGIFASWDEADRKARALLEELGEGSGRSAASRRPWVGVEEVQEPRGAPEGLLSAREAASLLGVSLSTFKDAVRAELPSVAIGRRVLFDKKDLETWASSHKAAGNFDSPKDGPSTRSGSVTLASASNSPRANQILAKLRSKRRGSTPRP
jgi:excisionase family DNA binding protein